MRCGVIDIGTNTVRSVVYDRELKVLNEIVFESTILKFTENGILTNKGIATLLGSIKKSSDFFKNAGAEKIFCLATSAMREVENFTAVRDEINSKCGIEIELLSESEEALCDFASIKYQLGESCSGAGVDLGGGSLQIMIFGEGELFDFCSKKLGVKRLYNMFGALSAESEQNVRDYVSEKIADTAQTESAELYVMGGTVKKIKKLIKALYNAEEITAQAMKKLLIDYYNRSAEYKKLTSTEYYKIPYGIIVLDELCQKFSSGKICPMSGGVREGYVKRRVKKI